MIVVVLVEVESGPALEEAGTATAPTPGLIPTSGPVDNATATPGSFRLFLSLSHLSPSIFLSSFFSALFYLYLHHPRVGLSILLLPRARAASFLRPSPPARAPHPRGRRRRCAFGIRSLSLSLSLHPHTRIHPLLLSVLTRIRGRKERERELYREKERERGCLKCGGILMSLLSPPRFISRFPFLHGEAAGGSRHHPRDSPREISACAAAFPPEWYRRSPS